MLTELILVLFLSCVLLYLKSWRMHKLTKNIPEVEPAYPLIGHAWMALRINSMADVYKLYLTYGKKHQELGILKAWFGSILFIGIALPKYIEIVANSPYATNKGKIYTMLFGDVFNGVVFAEGGTKWKELRKPLVKSLTKKMLETDYHEVFVRRSKGYAEHIRQDKLGIEFDIFHSITLYFLDIFSETHLGVQTDGMNGKKFNFAEDFDTFFESTLINIGRFHFYFKKLGEYLSERGKIIRSSKQNMNKFLDGVLSKREKTDRKCNGKTEYYSDFLLRRSAMKKMPYKEIRKELADMVLAGSDTSSIIANSAVAFLAMLPHVQEKAYQEQISIFGHSKRDPTVDDLASMTYLKMVIKETLRLIGVPGFIKTISQDIELDKYTLPKGSLVYLTSLSLHRHPKYWEKPEDFYPEHFLPEKEAERPPYSYIPFGVAPRSCPGFLYGTNSILVLVSTLLRDFELQTSMKFEDIVYDFKLLLQFNQGYNVKFIERNKN